MRVGGGCRWVLTPGLEACLLAGREPGQRRCGPGAGSGEVGVAFPRGSLSPAPGRGAEPPTALRHRRARARARNGGGGGGQ